jgi:hypothetical protein
VTDGERYAAYVPQAGSVAIIDTQTGVSKNYSADPSCAPLAAAAGHALLLCEPTVRSYYPGVMSLHTGAVIYPAGSRSADAYENIGRYWLAGADHAAAKPPVLVYLNWRTGERREGGAGPASCHISCDSPQLSGAWVTWATRNRAYAYSIRMGRRFMWRFPPPDPDFVMLVAHTRNTLFVSQIRHAGNSTAVSTLYQTVLK